jgi:hypothetical protein
MPKALPRLASGAVGQPFLTGFSLPPQGFLHLHLTLRLRDFLADRFGSVLMPQVNQFDALWKSSGSGRTPSGIRLRASASRARFLVQQLQMLVVAFGEQPRIEQALAK